MLDEFDIFTWAAKFYYQQTRFMNFDFKGICKEIELRDGELVKNYNQRQIEKNRNKFVLHNNLGPCPFEGDINKAPVVLLLGNPSSNGAETGDHREPSHDYPLWGLSNDASPELRKWWSDRLKTFITEHGAQYVSRSVAALQLNPWASEQFDSDLVLPSRKHLIFPIAESVLKRGGLLVVMRGRRLWDTCSTISAHPHKIYSKNPRCSYLSQGNFSVDHWLAISSAIKHYSYSR